MNVQATILASGRGYGVDINLLVKNGLDRFGHGPKGAITFINTIPLNIIKFILINIRQKIN